MVCLLKGGACFVARPRPPTPNVVGSLGIDNALHFFRHRHSAAAYRSTESHVLMNALHPAFCRNRTCKQTNSPLFVRRAIQAVAEAFGGIGELRAVAPASASSSHRFVLEFYDLRAAARARFHPPVDAHGVPFQATFGSVPDFEPQPTRRFIGVQDSLAARNRMVCLYFSAPTSSARVGLFCPLPVCA